MANRIIIWFVISLSTLGLLAVVLSLLVKSALVAWRRSSFRGRLSFFIAAFGAVLYAGSKARRMAVGLSLAASQVGTTVTEQDIDRGFREVSVRTNLETQVIMPTNAVAVGKWHVRGAYKDRVYIPFGDFDWIAGSNAINRVSVFTGARARPSPRDTFREISAVGGDLLAIQGRSTLWYQECPGGRTIGWNDFSSADDTNASVNAAITWRTDGSILAVSNGVEKVYARVSPGDWDGDGLPNSKDVNPYIYDGDYFGPENNLPEGCNSNAYCTISVVATGPDAEVRFEGDGPSNYPDPHFMAKSGVTNEVYILIGKAYQILSDQPIAIVDSSDPATDVWINDSRSASAIRPVLIEAIPPFGSMPTSAGGVLPQAVSSSDFVMSVSPNYLGGCFQWMDSCCTVVGQGQTFSFISNPDCTCGGCEVSGGYVYEGYQLLVHSPMCRCYFPEGNPHWSQAEAPRAASVSVSFSKDVVIFEDRYENTPGNWVEKNSTRTKLTITAWGGPTGSTLTVTGSNLNKLSKVSGANLPFTALSIPAGMEVSYEVVYEGQDQSESVGDILAMAFLETEDGQACSCSASVTSIVFSLVEFLSAPEGSCHHRHVFGVGEVVGMSIAPVVGNVEYRLNGSSESVNLAGTELYCPWIGGPSTLSIEKSGANLNVPIYIYEPVPYVASSEWDSSVVGASGFAGFMMMRLELLLAPRTVSFEGILMQEVPDETQGGSHSGYFDDQTRGGSWSHRREDGAGIWSMVSQGNCWTWDRVGRNGAYLQPWSNGYKIWPTPVAWSDYTRVPKKMVIPTEQRFELTTQGKATIRKYGHWLSRDTNGEVWLDGRRVN